MCKPKVLCVRSGSHCSTMTTTDVIHHTDVILHHLDSPDTASLLAGISKPAGRAATHTYWAVLQAAVCPLEPAVAPTTEWVSAAALHTIGRQSGTTSGAVLRGTLTGGRLNQRGTPQALVPAAPPTQLPKPHRSARSVRQLSMHQNRGIYRKCSAAYP